MQMSYFDAGRKNIFIFILIFCAYTEYSAAGRSTNIDRFECFQNFHVLNLRLKKRKDAFLDLMKKNGMKT